MRTIKTEITELLGIQHPIILAGMNVAAGPELAAAVSNAGGLGVIGGVGYTPKFLKRQIALLKKDLVDKNAPFGIDLLLPQVGGQARKTMRRIASNNFDLNECRNYDYTKGQLPELIDIIISEGAKLFVSAVGVPPRWAVDKLHAANILVMNMVGAPKHVKKALASGVDLICAQGGEGGGHTGEVATSILIPICVDLCRGQRSPLTGGPVHVIAAGGIFDGRGLAMALSLGAQAAWVGTRFVCATEAGAPKRHKEAVVNASVHDTVRTIIYTGRPLRCLKNPYIDLWENDRREEIVELTSQGVVPAEHDMKMAEKAMSEGANQISFSKGKSLSADSDIVQNARPLLMGQCAGAIHDVKPAAEIIREMIDGAVSVLASLNRQIVVTSAPRARM